MIAVQNGAERAVDMADMGFVEDGNGRRVINNGAIVHGFLSLSSQQGRGEAIRP
jgi:hypothetical protein